WERRAAELPRPKTEKEVVPGRTETQSPVPKPAAPPSPAVPNREETISDRNVSLPPTTEQRTSQLAIQNSSTLPVRLPDEKESRAGSFDPSAGQPVNVLALAAERQDVRNVNIAKGAQNIPLTQSSTQGAPQGTPQGADGSAASARTSTAPTTTPGVSS